MTDTWVIRVYGIVQGVGFRPFVSRLARRFRLCGSVCNKGSYVEIQVQGDGSTCQAFCQALPKEAPPRSSILKIDVNREAQPPYEDFQIIESIKEAGETFVSPDIAICDACKQELFDPANRRYLHPFINCTACGPRLTILDGMPYDRERTSMGKFPMCPACYEEYTHAETRRYDAQPVCCNDCGPEVYLLGRPERRHEAIKETRRVIAAGGLAAIKGIGGFHFCCDAANEDAVGRLRALKHRPVKPFAVMARDLAVVRRECVTTEAEEAVLDGHQKPIILLEKRPEGRISPVVAPDNPFLGVMLPYTPLHLLLFSYPDGQDFPDALVMTSANPSGAPLCRTDEDILALTDMCDCILSHNRDIRLRADDSVMMFYEDEPYMIRRSRGYAPLPYLLEGMEGHVLGIGGELKNTFCLGKDSLFYLSPHIGDMADIRTQEALRESLVRLEELLETTPQLVACDLHPRYETTQLAGTLGLPLLSVQHHYAHFVACLAENNMPGPAIGLICDGTGYGTDGTIWGGEVLIGDYHGFQRFTSLVPYDQYGGDAAAREGWRIAAALIHACAPEAAGSIVETLGLCTAQEFATQRFMYEHRLNCVRSTSTGRLYDAVSAILRFCRASTFEGEAAMRLEFAARRWQKQKKTAGEDTLPHGSGPYIRTDALIREIVKKRLAHADPDYLAWFFHDRLAGLCVAACVAARAQSHIETVALSGGVFQNRLFLALCEKKLQHAGFSVLRHHLVPANDGGLALGQAVRAAVYLQEQE